MNTLPQELTKRFAFNLKLLATLAEGLDESAWSATHGDGGNSAHWILGHVANTRRFLLRKLGVAIEEADWEQLFGMGTRPEGTAGFPPIALLLADLEQRQAELASVLGAMTEAAAATPFGVTFPDGGTTALEAASFLNFHETYHLGQIGLLRRQAGHPGFA